MNTKLRELYKSKFSYGKPCSLQELREKRRSTAEKERPAYPLLIKINEEKYIQSDIKIMLFGQETNSWERRTKEEFTQVWESHEIIDKTIDVFMNQYITFFNEKMMHKGIDSPFWNTIKKTNKELTNSKLNPYIIWNNIYKIGNMLRNRNRPCESIREFENSRFGNVIEEEINILKPDLLILLTGPYYEERVNKILQIQEKEQIQKNIDCNELAYFKLKFGVRGFRTYHPNHLYHMKKIKYIDLILEEIIKMKKQKYVC